MRLGIQKATVGIQLKFRDIILGELIFSNYYLAFLLRIYSPTVEIKSIVVREDNLKTIVY